MNGCVGNYMTCGTHHGLFSDDTTATINVLVTSYVVCYGDKVQRKPNIERQLKVSV